MEFNQENQIKICRILGLEPDESYKAELMRHEGDVTIYAYSPDKTKTVDLQLWNSSIVYLNSKLDNTATRIFIDKDQKVYTYTLGLTGDLRTKTLASDFATYKYRRQAGGVITFLRGLAGISDKHNIHPLSNFAAKDPGAAPKRDPQVYSSYSLGSERTGAIREILGTQKNVTVKHWMDDGVRTAVIDVGEESIILRQFSGDTFDYERYSSLRPEAYIHITKNEIRVLGNPLELAFPLLGEDPSSAEPQILERGRRETAVDIEGKVRERVESLFAKVNEQIGKNVLPETDLRDWQSDDTYFPRQPDVVSGIDSRKKTFDTSQPEAKSIIRKLGLSMPVGFINHGQVVFEPTNYGYVIKIQGPQIYKDTPPEEAEIVNTFTGTAKITITRSNKKIERYETPPLQFNEKTLRIFAKDVLGTIPLSRDSKPHEIHNIHGIVLFRMSELLVPR